MESFDIENVTSGLVLALKEKGYTVTTAESCTGGMIAASLVDVPGVSEVFMQGLVTYSNEAKMRLLGVKAQTLENHGAVSKETACEMALGGAAGACADVCIAVTGLAGPDGGTKEKPVGLVYMACAVRGRVRCERHEFSGDRKQIRMASTISALLLALTSLKEAG